MAAGGLIIDPTALSYSLLRATTSLTWAANVVSVVSHNHNYTNTQSVHIGGVTNAGYDGTFASTVASVAADIGDLTWAANVATFTHTAHGLNVGDYIRISGALPAEWNVDGIVLASGFTTGVAKFALVATSLANNTQAGSVLNNSRFSYPLTGDPGAQGASPGYSFKGDAELLVNQTDKKIKLIRVGNLTADGVTLKCIYSKLKELWKSDATLIKFPFPMVPITDEQFEFVKGWQIDKNFSSATEIRVLACSGTSGSFTVTSSNNFDTAGVLVGMYIGKDVAGLPANVGGTSGQEGAKVVAVSGTSLTLDIALTGNLTSVELKFWSKNDHSYNLIRTGGWALKADDAQGTTIEEWPNFTTLGALGAQGETKQITALVTTSASTAASCTSTTGLVVGSYITGPNLFEGTAITVIDPNGTDFTLSRAAKATASGGIATVRPKDQVYYQLGGATSSAKVFGLTGPANQALRTYQYVATSLTGDISTSSAVVANVSSMTGLHVGLAIAGTGIPASTVIASIDSATQITLSNVASATTATLAMTTGYDYRTSGSSTKLFVREQGYTYAVATKAQIGVSVPTYKVYPFPLSNQADLKITHADAQIDADGNNVADAAPYTTMSITWYATPQSRTIGGVPRDFKVIIDADTGLAPGASGTATTAQIYEFVQWSLRRPSDIDQGAGTKTGNITRELLKFVGDTLYTLYSADDTAGVYVDNFNTADVNSIVFADDTGTNRTFPYTAAGDIKANSYLVEDGTTSDAIYRMFFEQLAGGLSYGTEYALLVKKANNSTDIAGVVTGASLPFDFDYDGNIQALWMAATDYIVGDQYRNGTTWYEVDANYTSGGSFGATDTANNTVISGPSVRVTALGLSKAQAVEAVGVIGRSTTNSFSLVSALERNYANPV